MASDLRRREQRRWWSLWVCLLWWGASLAAPPELAWDAPAEEVALDDPQRLAATPTSGRFATLAEAEAFYRQLVRTGTWREIPPGPLLRLGDEHPQTPLIRARLVRLGDLSEASGEERPARTFDRALHEAVVRFQIRHGAKVDGVVGPETRRLLNVPPGRRLQQIRLNRARQASLEPLLSERYVLVNLPEYRLRLVERGEVRLEMKTIVGRRSRPSPELHSEIQTLVLNPSWNVPRSIAFRDILPRWRADSDYLSRENLRVVRGWSTPVREVPPEEFEPGRLYRGPEALRFWQPPGQDNALGQVKFDFPNRHSVYLHDTPAKSLFEQSRRALSSGCIRLEQPWRLAELLLAGDEAGQARFHTSLQQAHTRYLRLAHPVPLIITYWTAWLDESGALQFRSDIYRRDQRELALSAR